MIRLRTLPARGAAYHWRNTLPVALGVAVAAAVLTGALVVGESLRASLRERALRQLNGLSAAVVGGRFFRQEAAPADTHPAILLTGTASAGGRSLNRVSVVAVGPSLPFAHFVRGDRLAVTDRVADRMGLKDGDILTVSVEKPTLVPRASLLGRRAVDESTNVLRKPVTVLPAGSPAEDFSLAPTPDPPLNVFAPLTAVQEVIGKPGRANAVLAADTKPFLGDPLSKSAADLSAEFAGKLTLDDWGLTARVAPKRAAYVSVESERLVLSPAEVASVEAAAKAVGADSRRTYSYLANALSAGTEKVPTDDPGTDKKVAPYAVVAALDPAAPAPLGPFLPAGRATLADDEIVLVEWPDSPVGGLKPGDPVTLTYFKPELEAGVEEESFTFKLAGYLPLAGPADDPDLTPPFPGITDRLTVREWDSPFPINRQRLRANDPSERFWKAHKATPKAYITQAAGDRLFGSRFGSCTSVGVAPPAGVTAEQLAERLRPALLNSLDPAAAGLVFQPVRERALAASKGGTDFAGLLLAFSWLLIGTALLLVGLLFRLSTERRAREVGLLLAAGYSPRLVKRLLLTEGLAVAAVGAAVGVGLAVLYAGGMLKLLAALWPDDSVGSYLRLHVRPGGLIAGFVASVAVALAAVWFSLRGLVLVPPPMLLRGETAIRDGETRRPWGGWWLPASLAVLGTLTAVGGTTRGNPDERSMGFFAGGGLVLVAGLLAVRRWLRTPAVGRATGPAALGRRNPARSPGRSLLTVALIALGTFLIVSVESFRRRPDGDFAEKSGGSGGFALVAESSVPLFRGFDRGPGRDDLLDRLQEVYQRAEAAGGPPRTAKLAEASAGLDRLTAYSLRLRDGDDASCLNLYQAGRPKVLGVPDSLVERGGFRFGQTLAASDEERANPWLLLGRTFPDGAVPCLAEQNTALFMLKTQPGGDIDMTDEAGAAVKFRLVGLLQDSPFQSELLIGDASFRRLYPRTEGFRAFLIETRPGTDPATVASLLETGLRQVGLVVTPTADRVAAYQRVVGAYLTTFQLLGSLAVLLAVVGLGVVILRAVWERSAELALLRAVGYAPAALQRLIGAETLVLLAAGLGVGVVAATAAVLPNLALGGSVPWGRLGVLLLAVAITGLGVAAVATRSAARSPIVPALRRE
jgi:ABC-type antimicrobial peptide transport system permease subunit